MKADRLYCVSFKLKRGLRLEKTPEMFSITSVTYDVVATSGSSARRKARESLKNLTGDDWRKYYCQKVEEVTIKQ